MTPEAMTAEQWWANLLQGSVGALIGLVGLFLVFWLTRWHEFDREQKRREADERDAARNRTLGNVVRIEDAANAYSTAFRARELKCLRALSQALTAFSVHEASDHPKEADWAASQATRVIRVYLTEWESPREVTTDYVSTLTAGFRGWVRWGLDADVFAYMVEDCARQWERLEASGALTTPQSSMTADA